MKKEEAEDEDDEERLAEEKLRQLQEMAEKATAGSSTQPSSSSASSSSECLKSNWQQIGNLMLYTAAGVKGSNKVRTAECAMRMCSVHGTVRASLHWLLQFLCKKKKILFYHNESQSGTAIEKCPP